MDSLGQTSLSLAFVEGLYADYLRDPGSVAADWRAYFDEQGDRTWSGPLRSGPSFTPSSIFNPPGAANGKYVAEASAADIQDRADQLIRGYRVRGAGPSAHEHRSSSGGTAGIADAFAAGFA